MTPAAIAAMCGVLYSPPPAWDALPLPAGARVIEVPFSDLGTLCRHRQGAETIPLVGGRVGVRVNIEYGCAYTAARVAYVSDAATWPGTEACRLESIRHETDHLKGWVHL